jgi:ubiquinone/menaquinone biosynthesis C-methylase UbiE
MGFPLKSYEEIFEFYLSESQRVVDMHKDKIKIVLKTDLFNEEQGTPIKGGIMANLKACNVVGIEYQEDRVETAKKVLPECANQMAVGDIRKLPFPEEIFDIVIDLSTIDHIKTKELPVALKEYHRVLTSGGYVLLIAWTDKITLQEADWDPNNQYFFKRQTLNDAFKNLFEIVEYNEIFDLVADPQKKLVRYIGKKI